MALEFNKRVVRERILALFSKPHPAPLFIFGNQKSGTTAVASLLAAATGKRLIYDFAGALEPQIGRLLRGETPVALYVRRNAWAFSAPLVKDTSLTFVAPQLMEHFGVERAIFTVRDPFRNIRSILTRLELRGDTDGLVRTGTRRINRTWRSILRGHDLGLAQTHFITILAERWARAARLAAAPGRLTVRYEDFRVAQKTTIEGLARTLDLPVVSDIASIAERPFQPSGDNSIAIAEFFGPANLQRISEICWPLATEFGYSKPV